jgi:imidazolonepropionase-like amidohydrolase
VKYVLALLSLLLGGCSEPGVEPGLKALVGGRLEASLQSEPVPFSVIVIASGKVRAMGPQQTVPVPKGAETISTKGKVIRPMPQDGSIKVGESADLMIVDAETGAPDKVMRNGEWVR